MTDEQIIKALEICSDELIISCPDDCPFYDECGKDLNVLKRQALDLINRQKAEIERLNRELTSADEVIGFREAEIERLKEELDGETVKNMRLGHEVERLQEVTTNTVNSSIRFGLDKKQEIRKAKSEAYKEFAERLHQNCKKYPYTLPYVFTNIEITLKELTEGGNEDGMD